jgi:hypothetical protein
MLVWRRGTDTDVAESKTQGRFAVWGGFHKSYTSHAAAKLKKERSKNVLTQK